MQIGRQIVVSTVDQKIQNGQSPQFLQHLLTQPATVNGSQQEQLEALVQIYPQCSVFHLLLAKATQNTAAETASKMLQTAAVYTANREVLFRLIHRPELFIKPRQKQVYHKPNPLSKITDLAPDTPFTAVMPEVENDFISEENLETKINDASFIDQNSEEEQQEPAIGTSNLEETITAENDLRVEDINSSFINEPVEEIVFPTETETIDRQQQEEFSADKTLDASFIDQIDEEVYDEITAIEDIDFYVVKTVSEEKQLTAEPEKLTEQPLLSVHDQAEKEMLSNIASIDYFTFNNRFGQKQTVEAEEQAAEVPEIGTNPDQEKIADLSAEKEPETVSKYHDDKMPYTFMWWLDRTRKEYAGTYQPYLKVPQKQQTEQKLSVGPELNQQYIESIFHTKPPHGLAEITLPAVAEPPVKRKEDQLIERFIIEEPHIHPPSSDKLDTENKAKKSSEDGDVLVTETLAKIYLDQMLYHKALDTYKKLVLKFPEKSRYFTSQIELIEKKIN